MTIPGITAEQQDTAPYNHHPVSAAARTAGPPTDRQPTMTTPPTPTPTPTPRNHQS